jgi:hypothetical protein
LSVSSAYAATIKISYTGTLNLVSSVDLLGLNGANFEWVGVFDETATPISTVGGVADEFSGDIVLTFTGSVGVDGPYTRSV